MKKLIALLLMAVLLVCAAGCGGKEEEPAQTQRANSVDLAAVMQEILNTVSLPDMMTLTQNDLVDYFGLEAQWCADSAACINSNGYEKDEIILVRATDADSASRVQECLQKALENAAEEMKDYLPEQYAMIQNCKVESRDLYVWLFISDQVDQMQAILDKQF